MRKRYEKYKDSGIEWIGEVPVEWEMKKIKHTTYVKGRIGWQGLRSEEFIDEGPYLVTGTDFNNGKINWDTCYHISNERYKEAPEIQLKENDLLITKDGSIGKIAVVKNKPKKAILNSGIFVTRSQKNDYYMKYMYWTLTSTIFSNYIKYMELGSTIKHLYQKTFVNLPFPLPKLKEQGKIISYLDQKTTEVDSLIADKEKLIQRLQEYKRSVITEAVTKGLNPDVKMKDSGIEWIGEVPEHWELKRLRFLCHIGTGSKDTQDRVPEGKYPFFVRADTVEKINEYTYDEEAVMTAGDGVGVGKVFHYYKGKFSGHQRLYIFRNFNKCKAKYIYYYLKSNLAYEVLKSNAKSTVDSLRRPMLTNFPVTVPSLSEQAEIVDFIDYRINEIEKLNENIKESIQKLKEYRQSIIYKAVTGKIDIRDYKPGKYQLERSENLA